MTDSFNYSMVQDDNGTYVLRSVVNSFNLNHVTDKDIVSFYKSFSSFASFDTGLLPLDGTGVLAVRNAGPHTQIVIQHAPGMYYLNWGKYESDSHAHTYYVAQPYRIVIADLVDGNLLGARMFYSPYPITTPSQSLYHVNLPNINCRGYRGNGVGWICLYHKEDWSALPFNEKVIRVISRCSGIETYNDANMSETDGPRFYHANQKPDYLYDPIAWQTKSAAEGHQWTLDPDLWIPVLVKDLDHQDKHYSDGIPLTLAMAMLGNYQAYYSDTDIPKMYNILSRQDCSLDNKSIAAFLKKAFASAPSNPVFSNKDNAYEYTVEQRKSQGSEVAIPPSFMSDEDEDEDDSHYCDSCESSFSSDPTMDAYGNVICQDCLSDQYAYIESVGEYFSTTDSNIVWSETDGIYAHLSHDTIVVCDHCSETRCAFGQSQKTNDKVMSHFYNTQDGSETICEECFTDYCDNNSFVYQKCSCCNSRWTVSSIGWQHMFPNFKIVDDNSVFVDQTIFKYITLCDSCAKKNYVCPCGFLKSYEMQAMIQLPASTTFDTDEYNIQVHSCCSSCSSENGSFEPFNKKIFDESLEKLVYVTATGINIKKNSVQDLF